MLEQLLSYHQTLADHEFVKRFQQRLALQSKRRTLVLTIFGFIGTICAVVGLQGFVSWMPSIHYIEPVDSVIVWTVFGLTTMSLLSLGLVLDEQS